MICKHFLFVCFLFFFTSTFYCTPLQHTFQFGLIRCCKVMFFKNDHWDISMVVHLISCMLMLRNFSMSWYTAIVHRFLLWCVRFFCVEFTSVYRMGYVPWELLLDLTLLTLVEVLSVCLSVYWVFWIYQLCFKHILFRRKGLGVVYNATMPSTNFEAIRSKHLTEISVLSQHQRHECTMCKQWW